MNHDNVAKVLAIATCSCLAACALVIPFLGFGPLFIACAAIVGGSLSAKAYIESRNTVK
jgi:hypothetical protein